MDFAEFLLKERRLKLRAKRFEEVKSLVRNKNKNYEIKNNQIENRIEIILSFFKENSTEDKCN